MSLKNATPSRSSADGEPPMSNPSLEVVTVTFGRADLVERCLRTAREALPRGTTIHVVDNASPDETASMVAATFPEVDLRRRRTNDGFAVANNSVLADVTARYVLVLNPDTELAEGTVSHLVDLMDADPTIGIAGCRLVTSAGTLDHAAKRRIPTPMTALKYFALRALGRTGSQYTAPGVGEREIGDVDAVNGAFMLVRTDAMREVGLFDERFFMYGEDLDWCTRFRAAGWRVVYDGTVSALHLKGASSGRVRAPRLNYEFHRSMVIYYLKHLRTNAALDALVVSGVWCRFAVVTAVDATRSLLDRHVTAG